MSDGEKARISIYYGGVEYAVTGRSKEHVMAEINEATVSGPPRWLKVSTGQGRSTAAQILLGPAIPIAVWAVNADSEPTPTEPESADLIQGPTL